MGKLTPLDAIDLAAVTDAFALGAVRRIEPLWAGTINSNFRLETDGGTFFLRVNEGKSEDEVAYEADLVAHLAAAGVPTPRPRWARVGAHLLTLFPWIPGDHRVGTDVSPAHAAQVGAALADLHRAPLFPRRLESRYAFHRIVERFRSLRSLPPDVHRDLSDELDALAQRPALPGGVIHGDLFPDNVLWDGDRLAAVLDFEQAADGVFAYDVAVAVLAWCFDDDFDGPRAAGLVAGYDARRPLDAAERRGLYVEARFAAARFTITRLTDVEHNPAATPELRRAKDYRRYLARLRRLRALGEQGFLALLVV